MGADIVLKLFGEVTNAQLALVGAYAQAGSLTVLHDANSTTSGAPLATLKLELLDAWAWKSWQWYDPDSAESCASAEPCREERQAPFPRLRQCLQRSPGTELCHSLELWITRNALRQCFISKGGSRKDCF